MTDLTQIDLPRLGSALTLPCGAVLRNRLAKAAMTEGLADARNHPTTHHETLYRQWSGSGAGLLVTGNVFVDERHLERAGNVVVDGRSSSEKRQKLARWAKAASESGNHVWLQVNHAGRVTPATLNPTPLAASAVRSPNPASGQPVAMTEHDILEVIKSFALSAELARESGFTGVELHGAHGYLISQFLTPSINDRKDDWGGSIENRARLLIETLRAMRKAVGDDFPVAVKLNSADFQKGGFTFAESCQVVSWLNPLKLDLLEVSGGNFEHLAYFAASKRSGGLDYEGIRESTHQREAYFIEYSAQIARIASMPLMVTGGFRSGAAMDEALGTGAADVIGVGRPFCSQPNAAAALLAGQIEGFARHEDELIFGRGLLGPNSRLKKIRDLTTWGAAAWFYTQIHRLANGAPPLSKPELLRSLRYMTRTDAEKVTAHLKARVDSSQ